jgi:hypothetical protein
VDDFSDLIIIRLAQSISHLVTSNRVLAIGMSSDEMIVTEEDAGGSVIQVSGNSNKDDRRDHDQPRHVAQAQDPTGRVIARQA